MGSAHTYSIPTEGLNTYVDKMGFMDPSSQHALTQNFDAGSPHKKLGSFALQNDDSNANGNGFGGREVDPTGGSGDGVKKQELS